MTTTPTAMPDLDTKAVDPRSPEINAAFDHFMHAFESYRQDNDQRLAALEQRRADVLVDEKLARINASIDAEKKRLDDLVLKGRRPSLQLEAGSAHAEVREHRQAFETYVRGGETSGLKALETRALSTGSGPDGGYLVPTEIEATINQRLAQVSPIRAIASVRQVSSAVYKRPYATSGASYGWVGETDIRPQTAAMTLAEQTYPAMELYAMPAATQSLLDDAAVDLERWIADEVETVFAEQEGKAFIIGDGVSKPTGFLAGTPVANTAWAWGALGYVPTGNATGLAATNASDALIDLVYALKAGYRQNARFVLNRKVQAEIRKLKDANGHYLWQPPATAGGEASLLGFPVTEAEDMPNLGAGTFPIAFGDFRRGYLVVDRTGVRVLRDPFTAKPYVLFYTTKRVGGGIADYNAIKLLKVAAS